MKVLKHFMRRSSQQPEQVLKNRTILKKRQQQNYEIAKNLPFSSQILDKSIAELSKVRGKQKFGTFVKRITLPEHQELNFLADININNALEINSEGIPFTVKDHLKVKNLIQTCGFSHNVDPSTENSQVVQLLIQQGCVPFAHTNVPQGLLNIQTNNHVYGPSSNPYKKGFISGGSSGGQAGSIATSCAAFGISSDSAGSAKIPASFSGTIGFKPTGSKRLSTKGRVGVSGKAGPSIQDLDTSVGFMTRSIEDLVWLCEKTIGKSLTYNPYIYSEWNSQKYEQYRNKKLRIGFIKETHEMKTAPAILNCMEESIHLLKQRGHQVVQFNFPDLYKFRNFIIKVLSLTHFIETSVTRLDSEKVIPQSERLFQRGRYGRIGTSLRQLFSSSERQKQFYSNFNIPKNTINLLASIAQKEAVKERFLKSWNQLKIDILLSPVMPFTAPLANSNSFLINQLTFCGFQNVLQMPSGSVPIRLVKKEETDYNNNGFYEAFIRESIEKSQGLPVGLQITAPHMEDEICIAGMEQVHKLFPPFPSPTFK